MRASLRQIDVPVVRIGWTDANEQIALVCLKRSQRRLLGASLERPQPVLVYKTSAPAKTVVAFLVPQFRDLLATNGATLNGILAGLLEAQLNESVTVSLPHGVSMQQTAPLA